MGMITYSVFTKPWKETPLPELAALVRDMGFDAIEFPLRPGYQIEPEDAERGLPRLAAAMQDQGINVASVAGPLTEPVFAGCAAAGISIIRVMFNVGREGYLEAERRARETLEATLPLCERYGVKVGVQNHCARFVPPNSLGLRALLEGFDPRHIGAIWDSAHNALEGEEPELGLEIVWPSLLMINVKNAIRIRKTGPEAEDVDWKVYWTSGRQGFASWPRIARYVNARGYDGVLCLSAEYSAEHEVERLAREDVAYLRTLFDRPS